MFFHGVQPPEDSETGTVHFYFVDNLLLLEHTATGLRLPSLSDSGGVVNIGLTGHEAHWIDEAAFSGAKIARSLFVGRLDRRSCFAVELYAPPEQEGLSPRYRATTGKRLSAESLVETQSVEGERAGGSTGIASAQPKGKRVDGLSESDRSTEGRLELMSLRSIMGAMSDEIFRVAGVAIQVLDWDRNHQFCGRCGTPTVPSATERARTCPKCSLSVYPRISPAIIVAVTKGNQLLLANNRRHRVSSVYSVIAGFVDPGESLEECVRREVMEEVSLEVSDITYFSSQPWPFPDSLMVAFLAKYRAGTIKPDGDEIMDAGWYDRDHLPAIPPPGTVARRLIDWFVESHAGASIT